MRSSQGLVGGLFGSSSSKEPRVLRGCALKPFLGISTPALVSSPILSRSRRLKPAAISSRRLSAAVCFSFSFLRFRLEMYAIGKLLLLRAQAQAIVVLVYPTLLRNRLLVWQSGRMLLLK